MVASSSLVGCRYFCVFVSLIIGIVTEILFFVNSCSRVPMPHAFMQTYLVRVNVDLKPPISMGDDAPHGSYNGLLRRAQGLIHFCFVLPIQTAI